MKLSKQLVNIAITSAMTLIAMPSMAAGAAQAEVGIGIGGGSGAAEGKSSVEMQTPSNVGTPDTSTSTPNALGATEMSGTAKSSIDFDSIDSNKDGSITVGEYLKQGGTHDSFRQSDKNNDNKLDSSELMSQ